MDKIENFGFITVKDDVFAKMSDTQTPQGIITVLKMPEYNADELIQAQNPLLVLIEGLQDPGNLGTIIRTAEGAGVTGIIMDSHTVDIYNPKTIRSTMGSVYRMPFVCVEDLKKLMHKLSEKGIHTYAAHLAGKDYYDSFSFAEPTAFLIGNEGNGLTKELADMADHYIKIPMEGKVESLNAAIAASLLMYEGRRQRRR
jgi:TrmH family RNA methyltransferase